MRVFDLGARLSLDAGVGAGIAYFDQRFEGEGRAPPRRTWAGVAELVLGLNVELGSGLYGVVVQSYLLPMLNVPTHKTQLELSSAGRLSLGVGMRL